MLRIHEILVRIRGSIPLLDADPDLAIYVSDLQDINKKLRIFLLITFRRYIYIIIQR